MRTHWRAAAAAAALIGAWAGAAPSWAAPPRVSLGGWDVVCVAGRDGVSANCTAQAEKSGVRGRFETTDDVISLSFAVDGCPAGGTQLDRASVKLPNRSSRDHFYGTLLIHALVSFLQQCPSAPEIRVRSLPDILGRKPPAPS
ncbi:hypothetical protein ACFODL_19830 [Phenylobacterium terrae]|uniref:hypothetical protein n=1 Tax=Phenylobacterium terrae TaxID=2665495 RepID=UPI0036203728